MTSFNDMVLEWVKENRSPRAVEVLSVESFGSDMAGDTFSGFYDYHEVTVVSFWDDGSKQTLEVRGQEVSSLWDHVMHSWPEEVQDD